MRDDANQLAGGIPGQARVAVERDAVPHLRQDRRVADRHDEAGIGGATQQAVEFLDLSALALPSHPQPFLLVPLTRTMEQEEAIRAIRIGIFPIERGDRVGSRREDLCVLRHRFRARVLEVAAGSRNGYCGSRLPSACTSRCAARLSARATLSRIVGTITIVRADSGMRERSRRGRRRGGMNRPSKR